jgi:hypothetical protein
MVILFNCGEDSNSIVVVVGVVVLRIVRSPSPFGDSFGAILNRLVSLHVGIANIREKTRFISADDEHRRV